MMSKSGEKGKKMKTTAELLGELIATAFECKKHDVFVDYSPHVKLVNVMIYHYGWRKNKSHDEQFRVYLDEKMANEKLKATIGYIKHLSKEESK